MAIGALGLILINVGLALLQRLVAPRIPRRKPAPFEAPTVEDGQPITKGFGVFQVSGMVTMVRDIHTSNGDGDITLYYAKIQMAAGFGPVDILYDIIADERALSLVVPARGQSLEGAEPLVTDPPLRGGIPFVGDNPIKLNIAARLLFGGRVKEGGLQGQVSIYPGTDNQPIDPLVQLDMEDSASAFPHIVYAVFGTDPRESTTSGLQSDFYWTANNPTPKPISFIFGCYPSALLGPDNCRIGLGANWAEALFELFTNKVWGMGEDPSTFDIPQWTAKALQIKAEGVPMAGLFADRTVGDIKDDILSHINGEIVIDPTTSLVQLKLARDDYSIEDLPIVNSKNSDNFKQGKAQFAQTLNEVKVKYRRFESGSSGPQTISFELIGFGEPPFPVSANNFSRIRWVSGYNNIYDITATRDRDGDIVTLVRATLGIAGNDYYVNEASGEFQFYHNVINSTNLQNGDIVTVTFTAAPTFSGFLDATQSAQNPANRQITKRLRSEAYDYPLFITDSSAQRKADLLIKTVSRKLDVFSWTTGREFAYLTPLDVVNIHDPEKYRLTNSPVRITKISVGAPEQPALTFEGVEDIWGQKESATLSNVEAQPPVTPTETAPAMAALACAGEDVLQFQASDITFQIEIERADDIDGTNAEVVEDSPFDGTETTWTDPTPGKTHRARQIRSDVLPGPWTAWLDVCTTGTPGCVRPTYHDDQLYDGLLGTLVTTIENDPDGRTQSIRFQVTDASGALSEWVTSTEAPFIECVVLVQGQTAYITRCAAFFDCDGTLTEDCVTYPFTVPINTSDPPIGLTTVPNDLSLVTANAPLNLLEIPSARTAASMRRALGLKFPFDVSKGIRLEANIEVPGPIGSYIALNGEPPDGLGASVPVGDDDFGPAVYIDEASLDALDPAGAQRVPKYWVVTGASVLIRPELRADIRVELMIGGGDDVSGEFYANRISVQPVAGPDDDLAVTPPHPTDPPFDPGSCDVPGIADDFTYADLATLDAAWMED